MEPLTHSAAAASASQSKAGDKVTGVPPPGFLGAALRAGGTLSTRLALNRAFSTGKRGEIRPKKIGSQVRASVSVPAIESESATERRQEMIPEGFDGIEAPDNFVSTETRK